MALGNLLSLPAFRRADEAILGRPFTARLRVAAVAAAVGGAVLLIFSVSA